MPPRGVWTSGRRREGDVQGRKALAVLGPDAGEDVLEGVVLRLGACVKGAVGAARLLPVETVCRGKDFETFAHHDSFLNCGRVTSGGRSTSAHEGFPISLVESLHLLQGRLHEIPEPFFVHAIDYVGQYETTRSADQRSPAPVYDTVAI